mmetsp:Transcript_1128/g.1651  ORF Transcript_1128/g.1651 Transcript_1128/m.1651 type:complete len:245 (-) Transcript_1128:592-1326(-)|eukprot:CAMPEP_0204867072 /NCGR_PEP_ID=MMETSP1348-20121228/20879_1 /ASSEMBLY_ACC=CAM_ASM_000700 /TAXON_ID=215587 /ORGANISM="Aplanochytrium stocchinoi, Strain GSBS06" /LENGTH=244 /DNA_ID=CAMNT_0052019303 /DNA_START=115 /DNA_END=849 /DNA_ORIENTATION=-
MSTTDLEKKAAAYAAVDAYVKAPPQDSSEPLYIGIGSGSTIVHAVARLVERCQNEKLDIVCVPTSFQAKQLITENGLVLGSLEQFPQLDVAIDGADECDANLNCIKGGGGCLTQEKIVAYSAKTFVVVADSSKDSRVLGDNWKKGVPIEVIPMAYKMIQNKLGEAVGATVTPLRMAKSKAGPCVTDNGCLIIDAVFPEASMSNPAKLERAILDIPGVVCTGLFVGMVTEAFFGQPDGTVKSRKP